MPNIKRKSIEVYLDDKNKLNFTIIKEDGKLKRFAINYSAKIDDKWHAVYRADNYHEFVHEQRLWISNDPIPLPEYESTDLKEVFDMSEIAKINNNCFDFRACSKTRSVL